MLLSALACTRDAGGKSAGTRNCVRLSSSSPTMGTMSWYLVMRNSSSVCVSAKSRHRMLRISRSKIPCRRSE